MPFGLTLIVTHLGLLVLGAPLRVGLLGLPRPQAQPVPSHRPPTAPPRRRVSQGAPAVFALEFPPIENIVEWPAAFFEDTVFAFNKIALISLIAVVVPTILFLVAPEQGQDRRRCPAASRPWRRRRSSSSRSRWSCRPSAPTACATCPMLLSMFFFIFIGNLFEIIPTSHMPANARMANPASAGARDLGDVHRGRYQAQRARATSRRRCSRRACPRRSTSGDPHRVHLDLHRAALLAGGPALRQHAGRPHPAGDLLGALHRPVPGQPPSSWRCARWPSAMLVAFTGFELMVAFLQAYIFTPAHRRLHRRCPAPRPLIHPRSAPFDRST